MNKMKNNFAVRSLLFAAALLGLPASVPAQINISVSFGPPALPVYEQPICPTVDYLWVPGYWAYDNYDGYYWVPGTWIQPPQVGYLWTPGYWGWGGSAFLFHEGYWGPHVGFYGGINYGFGYGGSGYGGGRWQGNHFSYNTYVNHVNTTVIHNTYNTTINNVTVNHISYNGGNGGVEARASAEEEAFAHERHAGPVAAQTQHVQAARGNPQLRASANQGRPPIAATARPGNFKANFEAAREAGGEYKAPPANAARGNAPGAQATGDHANNHASDLQPHAVQAKPPSTGNPARDQRYQQQQENLAAKQNAEHQQLQQQQQREHQQATTRNYSDAQKQQMEQRHAQQTQHVEQQHAVQQQHLDQRQGGAARPEGHPPAERH